MIPPVGIHRSVPMRDYLAMHAVSHSLLQTVAERCPRAAWHGSWMNPKRDSQSSDAAQDAGTIAHSMLLEGHSDFVQVINPNDHPAEKTGAIPEGWTNKSIRAARDAALAAGKIPVFTGTMRKCEAMVGAAREYLESIRAKQPHLYAAMQPGGGESELTMVWEDEGGVLCRIRPDRCSTDWRVTVDYKTGGTTAEPDAWGRMQMVRMGYYGGAAFYRRGIRALTGVTTEYVFFVQEQEPPHLCSLVGMLPSSYDLGGMKTESALARWAECAAAGDWPGYPSDVCYPEIPAFEFSKWEGRERTEGPLPGNPYEISQLWRKPTEADREVA